MRRAIYAVLAVVAIFAVYTMHRATQTVVVERPSLGGPPPPPGPPIPRLVGKKMPPFDGSDALRGHVALVSVWATWCKPCQAELPRIEKEIWQAHRNEVSVIAIASGEQADIVERFNRTAKLTFPLIADPHHKLTELFAGKAPIPRVFVIDRAGVVRYQHIGYNEKSFKELLAAVEREITRESQP